MKSEKLKVRSSVGDLILYFFTVGLWGFWVAKFLNENISVVEKAVGVEIKPRLMAFDLFIILLYLGFFFMFNSFEGVAISTRIAFPFLGLIWLLSRWLRKRMLLIAETEKIGGSYIVPLGFSYVAIVLFAFTIVLGPFVSLYKTTNMYNELAETYNRIDI